MAMRALVTGANGHVGLNLCKALLAEPDVRLRASVRSIDDEAKVAPVRALGEMEVVGLDIRDPEQFRAALEGIDTLFHVAANYTVFTRDEAQGREIVRDSVEGVRTAMRAAAEAGVRKVVLTSSVVTLPLVGPDDPPVTESDWLSGSDVPYFWAKTEAERTAWSLSEELGVPLVTVLPGGVGGPGFVRRTPTIDLLEGIMLGALRMGAPRGNFTYVDARDVATGHVLAARKNVSGRFILCEAQPSFTEYAKILHQIDPEIPAAPWLLPDVVHGLLPLFDALNARLLGSARFATPETIEAVRGRVYNVSSERARTELGWQPAFPLRQSLRDTVNAIRDLRRREGKRRMA